MNEKTLQLKINKINELIQKNETLILKPLREKKRILRKKLRQIMSNEAQQRKAAELSEKAKQTELIMKAFINGETRESIAENLNLSSKKVATVINRHRSNELVESYLERGYRVDIRLIKVAFQDYATSRFYAHLLSPNHGSIYVDNDCNYFATVEGVKKAVAERLSKIKK